jgi:hypothetical protein
MFYFSLLRHCPPLSHRTTVEPDWEINKKVMEITYPEITEIVESFLKYM